MSDLSTFKIEQVQIPANEYHTYLFCSRNKDNNAAINRVPYRFTQRSYSLCTDEGLTYVIPKFLDFCKHGVDLEISRLYVSVNARNLRKAKTKLIVKLLESNYDSAIINPNKYAMSVLNLPECADEAKWLFDVDFKDKNKLSEFLDDLSSVYDDDQPLLKEQFNSNTHAYKTLNGYAVVVPHGFDTRKLMNKWKGENIELKRDAMLFVDAKAWNAQNNTVIDRFVGNPFRNKTFKDGSWVDKN